jgi:hypothetical protein
MDQIGLYPPRKNFKPGRGGAQIFETKVELGQCYLQLKKTFTPDNKNKILSSFLNNHPDIVLLKGSCAKILDRNFKRDKI